MFDTSLQNELDYIFFQTKSLWEELRNQRIFITGGTGFFGSWLLESFIFINKKLNLNAEVVVLTRNAKKFAKKCPHIYSDTAIQFYEGNVLDFTYPKGNFSYIIHGAIDTGERFNKINELSMFNDIIQGTKYILEFAKSCQTKKFLFISSGAVYGKQADNIDFLSEENIHQLDWTNFTSMYAAGKFVAECMCNVYAKKSQFSVKIARCFAFVGPYLTLDLNFAIGNFLLDKLNNKTILVKSDERTCRSYLYASDLAIWLWTILFRGRNSFPYNVGSDQVVTIKELAMLVANIVEPRVKVEIMQKVNNTTLAERYIPDITRAREDLNLVPKINLLDALQSTFNWFQLKYQALETI
jgi:dTDP-glucose 4,6-dehydratase